MLPQLYLPLKMQRGLILEGSRPGPESLCSQEWYAEVVQFVAWIELLNAKMST